MVTELSRYNLGVAFLRLISRTYLINFSDNWWILVACAVKFDL